MSESKLRKKTKSVNFKACPHWPKANILANTPSLHHLMESPHPRPTVRNSLVCGTARRSQVRSLAELGRRPRAFQNGVKAMPGLNAPRPLRRNYGKSILTAIQVERQLTQLSFWFNRRNVPYKVNEVLPIAPPHDNLSCILSTNSDGIGAISEWCTVSIRIIISHCSLYEYLYICSID